MALSSTFPAMTSRAARPAIPGSIVICPSKHAVEVRVGDIFEVTYRRQPPAPKDAPFRQRLSWTGSLRRAGKVLASFQSRMD
jgi:hypothetical protein